MTFKQWLKTYENEQNEIGDLARAMIEELKIVASGKACGLNFVIAEGTPTIYQPWRNSYRWIKNHLIRLNKGTLIHALDKAWAEFLDEQQMWKG